MLASVRTPWINLGLLLCATAFSLAIMEMTSRFVYPISAGPKFITSDGGKLASFREPGRTYRQFSSEYDAITTITGKGYRIPEVRGNPDIIFIGDSCTFGVGLSDNETFPFQYALSKKVTCANLGSPGWGTGEEIDRLEEALSDWGWRPRHVMLFMFAMTTSMSSGNDIVDNLAYTGKGRSDQLQETAQRQSTLWSKIYNYLKFQVLSFSNLARILKFHFGSKVRSVVSLHIDEQSLKQSLELTRRQLLRLQHLSDVYGFAYEIFLIHPVQDIVRGTADHTHQALQRISTVPIWDTAHLFSKNPTDYYYAYDGHPNARGNAAIAQFLLSRNK